MSKPMNRSKAVKESRNIIKKKIRLFVPMFLVFMLCSSIGLCGCQKASSADKPNAAAKDDATIETGSSTESAQSVQPDKENQTEIDVFIAASLSNVMEELADAYKEDHPGVQITLHADSSGTLMTQIEEGYTCDIFFSAAQKQMDVLEKAGLLVEGSRKNVVNNQVVVITQADSGTKVTGLKDLGKAESIALADGSVPVGKYTRVALANLGVLSGKEEASEYTTEEVAKALGDVEISEQGNVSKVLIAVTEGACEVGTVYYSDTHGYEEQIKILETVSSELTGDVIYPIAQVVNPEADRDRNDVAKEFLDYVTSDKAKNVFAAYGFATDIE